MSVMEFFQITYVPRRVTQSSPLAGAAEMLVDAIHVDIGLVQAKDVPHIAQAVQLVRYCLDAEAQ